MTVIVIISGMLLLIGLAFFLAKNSISIAKKLNMDFGQFSLFVTISINIVIVSMMLITINFSKKMTDKQISEIRETEKNRRKTAIRALRKELELNLDLISSYLDNKTKYLEGKKFSLEKVSLSNFDQGLVYLAVDDEVLINEIITIYHRLRICNSAHESIFILDKIPLDNKQESIKKWTNIIVENYETTKPIMDGILKKLQEIEKSI